MIRGAAERSNAFMNRDVIRIAMALSLAVAVGFWGCGSPVGTGTRLEEMKD